MNPRIILIGNSPLPTDNANTRPAAGLRTYQFIKALENAKIKFEIATIAMDQNCKKYNKNHTIIEKSDINITKKLQNKVNQINPDIIISINTYPSYLACNLKTNAAIWTDLNGWIMAEAQAQAFKSKSNNFLNHYHNIEKTIINRTDKISTVSNTQKHAILGELATYGRLNKETFGYNFIETIANGTTWFEKEHKQFEENTTASNKIDESKFNLLWLGGYNTWADTDTLFKGIEDAMKKEKEIYYISTGGTIAGLDEISFEKFLQKIKKSKFKNRFIFLGWVETEEIPSIYRKSTIGLNIDKMCYETTTGARNRINEMMKFGLPVISTEGSEISHAVKTSNTGFEIESGNSSLLTNAILEMHKLWKDDSEEFENFSKNGNNYITKSCSYEKTCKPLTKWIKTFKTHNLRSPDANINVILNKKFTINSAAQYFKKNGLKKTFKKVLQKLKI